LRQFTASSSLILWHFQQFKDVYHIAFSVLLDAKPLDASSLHRLDQS